MLAIKVFPAQPIVSIRREFIENPLAHVIFGDQNLVGGDFSQRQDVLQRLTGLLDVPGLD